MSEIVNIPKATILPKPDDFKCVVEESWSKFVPEETGVNAPVEAPFNREAAILKAVADRNR